MDRATEDSIERIERLFYKKLEERNPESEFLKRQKERLDQFDRIFDDKQEKTE